MEERRSDFHFALRIIVLWSIKYYFFPLQSTDVLENLVDQGKHLSLKKKIGPSDLSWTKMVIPPVAPPVWEILEPSLIWHVKVQNFLPPVYAGR